jgi:hypothetical protein
MSAPRFTVTLQPKSGVEPIRALRRRLKMLGRYCGLRAISISEQNDCDALPVRSAIAQRHGRRRPGRSGPPRRVPAAVGAMLTLRGRFDDSDVIDVCMLASCGLVHRATDAA